MSNKNNNAENKFSKDKVPSKEKSTKGKKGKCSRNRGKRDFPNSDRASGRNVTRTDNVVRSDDSKARMMDAYVSNDISWWNRATHLYADATRVPFNRIVGSPFPIRMEADTAKVIAGLPQPTTDSQFTPPGIMTIDYTPTIGWSADNNSEANRAFTNLYGDIYSKTTGAMQFTQGSLSMFTLSFVSILANIAYAKKALAYSDVYVGRNYYYPRDLLTAMGFKPDTIIGHQDELRVKLNSLIYNFNAMKIPAFLTVFDRAYTLARKLWADDSSVYAQLYNFRPNGMYMYSDTENKLTWSTTFAAGVSDFNTFLTKIANQLDAWRNSSDLGIIGGSIQRAFKDAQLLTITFVGVDEHDLPESNAKYIMDQISNMTIIGDPALLECQMDITENVVKNNIFFTPKFDPQTADPFNVLNLLRLKLLKSHDGVTDADFVMEATRLMAYAEKSRTDTDLCVSIMGTEWIMGVTIYTRADGTWQKYSFEQMNHAGALNIESFVRGLTAMSAFKYHPDIFVVFTTGTGDWADISKGYTIVGPLADEIRVFTTVDIESLRGLTTAALQSVFMPPELNI